MVDSDRSDQKKKKRRFSRSWWWRVPLIIFGVYLALDGRGRIKDSSASSNEPQSLPSCEDDSVKETIRALVEKNTTKKGVEFLDWKDVRLIKTDGKDGRYCKAFAFFTLAETEIYFHIFYPNEKAKEWLIRIDFESQTDG